VLELAIIQDIHNQLQPAHRSIFRTVW